MGVLINIIIGVVFFALMGWNFVKCDDTKAGIYMIGWILSIVVFFGNFIMLEIQPWDLPDSPYRTEYIVAMGDNNQVNGEFYARRGYIEENLYYQYMKKVSDGGYKAGKCKADATTLYYADDNFRVERFKKTKKWLWLECEAYYNKIYIPEGSITDEYSVDLQ